MDSSVATFLAVTGVEDESVARQFLDITNNDLDYAVTLYMESNPPQSADTDADTDEQTRRRFLSDGDNEVRQADAAVHRHETLVDSFGDNFMSIPNMSRPTDIFGGGRVGIFNQRFDDDENDFYFNQMEEVGSTPEEEEDDEVMELDSDGEVINTERRRPSASRRRMHRRNRMDELTSTQRRLASLFRPPFDIMSKINLDIARMEGRSQKKWILINIQDSSEFACQVLNRDFWSNSQVKDKVRENFIFLQYQQDSPNGTNYSSFYSVERFPHIAILDPLTGERVRMWPEGEVPNIDEWTQNIDDFIESSPLDVSKKSKAQEKEKFNPESLSEEKQLEYAMKQSLSRNEQEEDLESKSGRDIPEEEPEEPEEQNVFDGIKVKDHTLPENPQNVTRVQVRFPNGKRIIHKFEAKKDTILSLYEWLKYLLSNSNDGEYGLAHDDKFLLSNAAEKSTKLIEMLHKSIEEANLSSATILIEKD